MVFNLAGCLSNEEIAQKSGFSEDAQTSTSETVVHSGSTGDGPIVGATITFTDKNNRIVNRSTSDGDATYSIEVPRASLYPLLVSSSGGTDLITGKAPDFTLYSIAVNPGDKTININPFSTLIVRTASHMGGFNKKNLQQATSLVTAQFNFGLDSGRVSDPVGTAINSDNVTTITVASELLSEALRRTGARQQQAVDMDDLIDLLAQDLADGTLDGNIADGKDIRNLLDIYHIAAGEIILELMSGNFAVNGEQAVASIETVIQDLYPESHPNMDATEFSDELRAQWQQALLTAYAHDPDPSLANALAQIDSLTTGMPVSSLSLENVDAVMLAFADAGANVSAGSGLADSNAGNNTAVNNEVDVQPVAHNDDLTVETNSQANINVLENDTNLDNGPVAVGIVDDPTSGSVSMLPNNQLQYTPNQDFKGADSFIYSVIDKDGDMATASVSISVLCSSCSNGSFALSLSWNTNPDQVDGYRVFFGNSQNSATTLVSDTSNTVAAFDSVTDLALSTGDTACFRLKAYKGAAESGFSEAICTTI